MDQIKEMIEVLWANLVAHLQKVLPGFVLDIIGQLPAYEAPDEL